MLSETEFSEKMEFRRKSIERSEMLTRERATWQQAVEDARKARPRATGSLSEYNLYNQEFQEIERSAGKRIREIDHELDTINQRLKALPRELAEEGFPLGTWVRWGTEAVLVEERSGEYVLHTEPWRKTLWRRFVATRDSTRAHYLIWAAIAVVILLLLASLYL